MIESEGHITIDYAGSVVKIEKTADVVGILNTDDPDHIKITKIFSHFCEVSKLNILFKDIDMTNYCIGLINSDVTNFKNIEYQNLETCKAAINIDYSYIQYVKNQTQEICEYAVRKSILALKYIEVQDIEICKLALDLSPSSFKYIKIKTKIICAYAIDKYVWLIENIKNQTDSLCLLAVTRNGNLLRYVKNQTPEICLAALKNIVFAIQFIDPDLQTIEMCNIVNKNIHAHQLLRFIRYQSPEVCIFALKTNIQWFKYIKDPTIEMCLYVIEHGTDDIFIHFESKRFDEATMMKIVEYEPKMIQYLKMPSINIELYAIKQIPSLVKHVKSLFSDCVYIHAVSQDGLLLKDIDGLQYYQDDMAIIICLTAVKQNGLALKYCTIKNTDICMAAIQNNPMALEFIDNQTIEHCMVAVSLNGLALKYCTIKNTALYEIAINNNPMALEFVDDQTNELCMLAVKQNPMTLKFVKNKTSKICLVACTINIDARIYVPSKFTS